MSEPTTEIEALHADIHEVANRLAAVLSALDLQSARLTELDAFKERLDQLVASHNQVGENVAWLVANTQGIFQMFNSPEMMNQMMGMVLGGGNAPRPAGPAEGNDS